MYAGKLLRGIPNKDFLDTEGPSAQLFFFKRMIDGSKTEKRTDEFYEESIFWYDDEDAVELILNQKKENKQGKPELQFKAGAAVLLREELDEIRRKRRIVEKYAYERKEIDGNKYHGNLLCHQSISVPLMKLIANTIACLCVERVIPTKK